MGLLTDIYLNLLGVGELFENAATVVEDALGRRKPRDYSSLAGAVRERRSPFGSGTVYRCLRCTLNCILWHFKHLQTAIVTGGNAGVGLATAEALLRHGSDVVIACRSAERGAAAAARLEAAVTGGGGTGKDTGGTARGAGTGADASSASAAPAAAGGAAGGRPGRVHVELLDLASLESVRDFVRRWRASGRQLDLLICK